MRQEILSVLCPVAQEGYGLELTLSASLAAACLEDRSGDNLDAALCAVQAGWAAGLAKRGYGAPAKADPLEGWIVDPALLPDQR